MPTYYSGGQAWISLLVGRKLFFQEAAQTSLVCILLVEKDLRKERTPQPNITLVGWLPHTVDSSPLAVCAVADLLLTQFHLLCSC